MRSGAHTHIQTHNFVSVGEIMLCLFILLYYFCLLYCVCVWTGRSLTKPEAHCSSWVDLPISAEDQSDPSSAVLSLQAQRSWFLVKDWDFLLMRSSSEQILFPTEPCPQTSVPYLEMDSITPTELEIFIHLHTHICISRGEISSSSMSNLTIANMTFSEDTDKYEGHVSSTITRVIYVSSNQFKRACSGPSKVIFLLKDVAS